MDILHNSIIIYYFATDYYNINILGQKSSKVFKQDKREAHYGGSEGNDRAATHAQRML